MPTAVAAVLGAFARLGLTSFGGPIAHLGFFRDEFVTRRRWETDRGYAELVALCQFLPGPASSQVGFAIGLRRAGLLGALAAFIAFTLPSALIMVIAAASIDLVAGPVAGGAIDGLKVVAVAVVAQAVWGMSRTLAPDRPRASIAIAAAVIVLGSTSVGGSLGGAAGGFAQVTVIVLGAAAGVLWLGAGDGTAEEGGSGSADGSPASGRRGRRLGIVSIVLFALLLIGTPLLAAVTGPGPLALFDAFYRSGALVFGGGHVVLPLLQTAVVDTGWVDGDAFLAGYGAAQALPGPLFAFAAYLGALATVGPGGVAGAAIALAGIFLPGFLLLLAALPVWSRVRRHAGAAAAVRGASAAVVGILGAALYDPVFTTAVTRVDQFVLALVGFGLLVLWRCPPWIVVLGGALVGALAGVAGDAASGMMGS
ncbi:chromate efflux transporter [Microbacterium radiodurans]|uniref:Chromate efflux transporter n=1 Tax=Microbacterium radiodurans TaxID=661398 RepID=A0A5J5IPT8_9MICO|nr:chromate efflux transporter [Microbacterium radiodurans]KAA9085218.1 chromate efflux transporter [Microbacterium radiodurans]